MKYRFHVLGVPHTVTNKEFSACAYTQKALKFCKMMTERGHHVIHYGHEDSDVICTEHVTVLSRDTWNKVYGDHNYREKWFKYDLEDEAYKEFFKRGIEEVEKRKEKHDFLLPFWGFGVKPICDHHSDMIVVEPGIGYGGAFARYRVFESYAIYHGIGGIEAITSCNQDWYHVVIPNYFDLEDFEFNDKKEDYMLFVGRVYDGKGVNIAIQVTQALGVKLKIAGQLDDIYKENGFPDHVEYVGYVTPDERKELMKNAMGSYLPSMYSEPFGGVQIENLLCGTPTITTDWGAFSENNIDGVTGYRCRTFGEFLAATRSVMNGDISYESCRKWGENFSLENVALKYERYFKSIMDIYTGHGWYEL